MIQKNSRMSDEALVMRGTELMTKPISIHFLEIPAFRDAPFYRFRLLKISSVRHSCIYSFLLLARFQRFPIPRSSFPIPLVPVFFQRQPSPHAIILFNLSGSYNGSSPKYLLPTAMQKHKHIILYGMERGLFPSSNNENG